MKVCIIGASGKLGKYMVQHALDRGYEVVCVCRERSVGKLDAFKGRITIIAGQTNDRQVIKKAVAGCDGVLTVLFPWGIRGYSSGTAQAVLDYARPGARLVFSCGWHITRDGKDAYSRGFTWLVRAFSWLGGLVRAVDVDDQVGACRRVFASDTRWPVVRGSDLEEGESQGLPVWSRHVATGPADRFRASRPCPTRPGTCSRSSGTACRWKTRAISVVESSRGCPYSCDFCVAPIVQGHKFRERSAVSLVDEIERGKREHGVRHFYLWGDTVTLNANSFSGFCEELIAKLDIRWFGNARADNLTDPAFVARLRQSGCWMLSLGIESESDEVRRDMLKRLERQKIQSAFRNMRQAGILSFAFFILGYPGETRATIERTIDYALQLDPDFANFYPAVPYPGTDMYEKCRRDGSLVSDDWTKMEYSYYLLRSGDLDETAVLGAIKTATRRFFLRPSWMLRHAGDIARLVASNRHLLWYAASRIVKG